MKCTSRIPAANRIGSLKSICRLDFSAEQREGRANLARATATAMGAVACPFSAQQVMQKVHSLTDN
jgi:hypothetical protein